MASKSKIRDRAANVLGILRLGQNLRHQDKVRIEEAYSEVYAELKDKDLTTWAEDGDVPNSVVPFVVYLVALNCNADYGISQERYVRIVNVVGVDGQLGRDQIRRNVSDDYVEMDEPEDF